RSWRVSCSISSERSSVKLAFSRIVATASAGTAASSAWASTIATSPSPRTSYFASRRQIAVIAGVGWRSIIAFEATVPDFGDPLSASPDTALGLGPTISYHKDVRLDPKLVHPSIFKATDRVVWSGEMSSPTPRNAKAVAEHQRIWFEQYGAGCLTYV